MDTNELILEAIKAIVASPGIWGFVGVLTGAITSHFFQKQRDRDSQIRSAFAHLHGLQKNLKQLYVSRFEAYIYSDCHEGKWRNSGYTSAIDLSEATRWMEKSESLVLEISKMEQALAESCGTIFVFFRRDKPLIKKTKALLSHVIPNIQIRPEANWDNMRLDEWKTGAVIQLQRRVEEIFDPLFADVLNDDSFKI